MGAFILFLALGQTIGLLAAWHYVRATSGATDLFPFADLPRTLLGWIVGLYLLFGGPGLRQLIVGLRRAGAKDA